MTHPNVVISREVPVPRWPLSELGRARMHFANPGRSVRGWERAVDAQARIVGAVERLVAADRTAGDIAIVSHGAVGALLYCKLSGNTIDRRFDQPGKGGGNFFSFSLTPPVVYSSWMAIDQLAAAPLSKPIIGTP